MGAWGIARLAPESPAWLKLTFAIVWLFALTFGALLLASKGARKRDGLVLTPGRQQLLIAITIRVDSRSVLVKSPQHSMTPATGDFDC